MSDQVVEAIQANKRRGEVQALYRRYYNRDHPLVFASQAFKNRYQWILNTAVENLCEAIVSSFTSQIGVQSWQGEGGKSATEASRSMGLRKIMNLTHDNAFVTGDGYVITWTNEAGDVVPYVQQPEQMYASCYAGTNRVKWAAKMWTMKGIGNDPGNLGKKIIRARVNIYTEVGVERYYAPGSTVLDTGDEIKDFKQLWPEQAQQWVPYDLDGEGSFIAKPSGVEGCGVFWFPHNQQQMGLPGGSILRNVVPIQDGLNHSFATLICGTEAFAQPLRLILAASEQDDSVSRIVDGELVKNNTERTKVDIDPTKESIVKLTGDQLRAVQLDPPDATRLITIQDGFALKMARVVGLPAYYLTQTSGDIPSGQALRVLRERMTSEVSDFEDDVTDEWSRLLSSLGLGIAHPEWKDPAPLDPLEKVQIVEAKKRMGYPFEELLIDLGEQPEDIIRILQKKQEQDDLNAERFAAQQQSGLRFLQGNED